MLYKLKFIALLLVSLIFVTGYAATYTIYPLGNDSDDTSSIQDAIDDLSSGDTLVLSGGTFLVSSGLTLTESNVTVTFSSGAKIQINGDDGVSGAFLCASDNLTFNNLHIDGSNKCSIALQLYCCDNVTLNSPTIENIDGSFFSPVKVGEGIRVRTSSYVTIDDALIKNIISTTSAATGIHCTSLSTTSKSYETIITDSHIENVKATYDSDGIKFLGPLVGGEAIDTYSEVSDSTFYNCHKRAIKIQTGHVSIDGVDIVSNQTGMDANSYYQVDFQHADDSSLENSTISVAGKHQGAIGIWGDNITIDNVDIYQNRKTTELADLVTPYRTYAIRKDGSIYCTYSTISNVNIYGNFTEAVYFFSGTGSGDNITLENIHSRDSLVIQSGLTNITVRDCSFGSYSYSGTLTDCLTTKSQPVAHYKLDESSGQLADASGSNDSTTVNNISYSESGIIGGAIAFNGTSSYAGIPNSSDLENLTQTISIAAWIYPNDTSGHQVIVNKRWSSSDYGFDFRLSGNQLRFEFHNGTEIKTIYSDSNAVAEDVWQHVAVIYDGKLVKFFINGNLYSSEAATGLLGADTSILYIGRYRSSISYFDGKMDDIRIYNRPLTKYQIKEAAYMSAYYKLEHDNNDETGYNDCTTTDSPDDATGKVDDAYDFSSGSHLTATDHDTLDLGQNLTISAWIKPDTLPWGATIVNKKFDSNSDGYELRVYYKKLKLIINSTTLVTTQDLLNTNIFQHVTVTFDGTDAKFYIDSIYKETVSVTETIPVANTNPVYIGIYQNGSSYPFDGIIDEVRLYKCKLEQEGVIEAFNEGWEQYNQER